MTKQEEIGEAMMKLFPNDCRVITFEETKRDKEIAKAVHRYIMGIEKARKMAARSKLRFRYGN